MKISKLVAITTVIEGDVTDPIQKIRTEVFLDTVKNLSALQIPCIAIYRECSEKYLAKVKKFGVILISQVGKTMGVGRREAIKAGCVYYPQAAYYLWLEPEKAYYNFSCPSNCRKNGAGKFNLGAIQQNEYGKLSSRTSLLLLILQNSSKSVAWF